MRRTGFLTAAAVGTAVVASRRRTKVRGAAFRAADGSGPGVDNPTDPTPVCAPEPLAGRRVPVVTEDGVALAVDVHGPADATATFVLAHGYVQSSRLWAGQVRDLLAARTDLRVVTYDHRGHGESGRTPREGATLEQLARDLLTVIDAVAPEGPVLLAGHSMGGMTIMALAEASPELFGDRITGVALVGTSAGGLAEVTYGLPTPLARAVRKALPVLHEQAVKQEARGRKRVMLTPLETRLIFPKGADKGQIAEALAVHRATRAETMAFFLPTFSMHDRLEVLKALAEVPVVVVVGDRDLLCPLAHSQALAAALPQAELAVYPGVGHMVQLERRPEVSRRLLALLDRTR